MTSSLLDFDNVLVAPLNNRTMHITVQLQGIKKTIDTTASLTLVQPVISSILVFYPLKSSNYLKYLHPSPLTM